MKIYGFQKTTLLDYPEHVAATIFTGGCNFRCPFCQNGGLVLMGEYGQAAGTKDAIPEDEIFAHLRKRQRILDGLCITGGEPTLQPDLEDFIRRVRELGYAVKLDTNGYRPEVLERLLGQGLLDYVAMDIKACRENYVRAVGLAGEPERRRGEPAECGSAGRGRAGFEIRRIEESIRLLRESGISYEFRTTAVKGLHTVEEFEEIGRWLADSRAYFIQSYEEQGEILGKMNSGINDGINKGPGGIAECFGSFDAEELQRAAGLARRYIDRVELRGVDL